MKNILEEVKLEVKKKISYGAIEDLEQKQFYKVSSSINKYAFFLIMPDHRLFSLPVTEVQVLLG